MNPKTSSEIPKGSRGGVSRVTTKGGESFDHDETTQHFKPDGLPEGAMATVGVSASVGRSTEYAREKYEVAAWCSLPVLADDEGIREGYDVAYEYVMRELQRRESDVQARFFPHLKMK